MNKHIDVHGSDGEGGGQILRSALALSLVTGRPFTIRDIRGGRQRPGLLRQHLTAVEAARAIGGAKVEGAKMRSSEVAFTPGRVVPGQYHFTVGTAGSAVLVLQTILPALLMASGPSSLILEGGTHNPAAPPFDFLDRTYLAALRAMGAKVHATLDRPGFYPAGGGRFTVEVEPIPKLQPIVWLKRDAQGAKRARVLISEMPTSIAQRELRTLSRGLGWTDDLLRLDQLTHQRGPGNVVQIEVEGAPVPEIITTFARRGVRAEEVAKEAIKAYRQYLASEAPVGEHLADQLLLPLALAGGGRFRTSRPSGHTRTNMAVISRFLPVEYSTEKVGESLWEIGISKTHT